jgi:hypothetical protein
LECVPPGNQPFTFVLSAAKRPLKQSRSASVERGPRWWIGDAIKRFTPSPEVDTERVLFVNRQRREKLPPEFMALLERSDLRYFDVFFGKKHIARHAGNSLEFLACRPL